MIDLPIRPKTRAEIPWLLNALFNRALAGAEVGVQAGRFTETLLRQATFAHFFCVDLWAPQPEEIYPDAANVSAPRHERLLRATRHRIAPFGSRVKIIRDWSHVAARMFSPGTLDFVYIDANHATAAVAADLAAWFPLVARGGVMAGHDYTQCPGSGVKEAVDAFALERRITVHATQEAPPYPTSWLFLKP